MSQLVSYWGWSQDKLYQLNHRHEWKIEEVKIAHAELLEALMQSYRNLIQFARRNNISESINPEDIGILSRKLYAAFESLPGKVQRINLKIAPDLSEPDLSFVQVPHGRLNRAGWYLYKHSLEPVDIIGRAPLEFNGYISKLVSWAYFNNLLTPSRGCTCSIRARICTSTICTSSVAISQAASREVPARHQPSPQPSVRNPSALHLPQSGDGSDQSLGRSGDQIDANTVDVFSFGRNQECLVGSVDLVYRNSWSEIRTLHFQGDEAVVDALTTILGKMHQDAAAPR